MLVAIECAGRRHPVQELQPQPALPIRSIAFSGPKYQVRHGIDDKCRSRLMSSVSRACTVPCRRSTACQQHVLVNADALLAVQVCQEHSADGSVQAVELYVQLSPGFSLGDLRVLVGRSHVEITEKVQLACRLIGEQSWAVLSCGLPTPDEDLTLEVTSAAEFDVLISG
jgi:hypothetical protein